MARCKGQRAEQRDGSSEYTNVSMGVAVSVDTAQNLQRSFLLLECNSSLLFSENPQNIILLRKGIIFEKEKNLMHNYYLFIF